MFGYVIPDKPNLFIKDYYAFKAFYCGLCKATGKSYGQLARFSTNYDSTILNILVHNLVNKTVEYKDQRCVLHPFTKKTMIVYDDLTTKVVDLNVLLLYYKLCDNVVDGESKKKNKTIRALFKKSFKKARKRHPEANEIISRMYDGLRKDEECSCNVIDKISDHFASMMRDLGVYLVQKEDDEIKNVFYALGKWIYLIDALDDLGDDYKSKSYNPWISAFGNFEDDKSFIEKNHEQISSVMYSTINSLIENYDKLDMPVQEGVLSNTFYYGLKMQTEKILRREEKCQKTRL